MAQLLKRTMVKASRSEVSLVYASVPAPTEVLPSILPISSYECILDGGSVLTHGSERTGEVTRKILIKRG